MCGELKWMWKLKKLNLKSYIDHADTEKNQVHYLCVCVCLRAYTYNAIM